MAISIFSAKGGVGKTMISLNYAFTKGWAIVTNDLLSPLDKVMKPESLKKLGLDEEIPDYDKSAPIIYDLGGHLDRRIIKAFKQSEMIIVPVLEDFVCMQVTVNTLKEIEVYNKNIIILANRITSDKEFEKIKQSFELFFDYPIIRLKESKSLSKVFTDRKSIEKMVSEGGLKKHHYTKVKEQFDLLISRTAA